MNTAGAGGKTINKQMRDLISSEFPVSDDTFSTQDQDVSFGAGGMGGRRILIEIGSSTSNTKNLIITKGVGGPDLVGLNEYIGGPTTVSRDTPWVGDQTHTDKFSVNYSFTTFYDFGHIVSVTRTDGNGGGWGMDLQFYAIAYPRPLVESREYPTNWPPFPVQDNGNGEDSDKKMIIKLELNK